jgi:uncharacterized protein (DUF1810 family)
MSRRFGLADLAEAVAYAHHPVLGARLLAVSRVAADQIKRGVPLEMLMGSDIDVLKLVSSMTLFEAVSEELSAVAREILTHAEAHGHQRCRYTLGQLQRWSASGPST